MLEMVTWQVRATLRIFHRIIHGVLIQNILCRALRGQKQPLPSTQGHDIKLHSLPRAKKYFVWLEDLEASKSRSAEFWLSPLNFIMLKSDWKLRLPYILERTFNNRVDSRLSDVARPVKLQIRSSCCRYLNPYVKAYRAGHHSVQKNLKMDKMHCRIFHDPWVGDLKTPALPGIHKTDHWDNLR